LHRVLATRMQYTSRLGRKPNLAIQTTDELKLQRQEVRHNIYSEVLGGATKACLRPCFLDNHKGLESLLTPTSSQVNHKIKLEGFH
jgi:hypothetical protein